MTIYNKSAQGGAPLLYAYDLETFPNFFLANFKAITPNQDGTFESYTFSELDGLRAFVRQPNLTLVGYNNFNFDDILLKIILNGTPTSTGYLCECADTLINSNRDEGKPFASIHKSETPWTSVDLMQILSGPRLAGSLKSHEVKLGLLNVQDLPYKPGSILTQEQIAVVTDYCQHDVNATEALYFDLQSEVKVRHEVNRHYAYLKGPALRRSNASIAEEVMKQEFVRRSGVKAWDTRKPERYPFDPANALIPPLGLRAGTTKHYWGV